MREHSRALVGRFLIPFNLKDAALPRHSYEVSLVCRGTELNRRHTVFQTVALPTELPRLLGYLKKNFFYTQLILLSIVSNYT